MEIRRAAMLPFFVFATAAAASIAPIACSGDPPPAGFEKVSGGVGAGGGEGGAGSSGPTTGSGSSATGAPQSSAASSGAGGAGAGGAGPGGVGGAGTGGDPCTDIGPEPNDTEGTATDLGVIDDCDGSGLFVGGILSDPNDVDWYSYFGEDLACVVSPTRAIDAAYPIEICKYIQCYNGTATLSCPNGTWTDVSPFGNPGCCSFQGFGLEPDCDGFDDSATVLIRIGNPDALECVPYTLDFNY